ncbi:hypothetical protein BJ508DRAFT_410233 [Ascobolus immersus RN42]|uniref:Uncharacterized protein n=1 Tax=Ascobolus immersus RN42 TaxID=1160509 RepID=A0A3N4J0M6_ASCIM|nr:hypothetical protein BJ508DRAFT_410233 [Ascobolus immersus RN42]
MSYGKGTKNLLRESICVTVPRYLDAPESPFRSLLTSEMTLDNGKALENLLLDPKSALMDYVTVKRKTKGNELKLFLAATEGEGYGLVHKVLQHIAQWKGCKQCKRHQDKVKDLNPGKILKSFEAGEYFANRKEVAKAARQKEEEKKMRVQKGWCHVAERLCRSVPEFRELFVGDMEELPMKRAIELVDQELESYVKGFGSEKKDYPELFVQHHSDTFSRLRTHLKQCKTCKETDDLAALSDFIDAKANEIRENRAAIARAKEERAEAERKAKEKRAVDAKAALEKGGLCSIAQSLAINDKMLSLLGKTASGAGNWMDEAGKMIRGLIIDFITSLPASKSQVKSEIKEEDDSSSETSDSEAPIEELYTFLPVSVEEYFHKLKDHLLRDPASSKQKPCRKCSTSPAVGALKKAITARLDSMPPEVDPHLHRVVSADEKRDLLDLRKQLLEGAAWHLADDDCFPDHFKASDSDSEDEDEEEEMDACDWICEVGGEFVEVLRMMVLESLRHGGIDLDWDEYCVEKENIWDFKLSEYVFLKAWMEVLKGMKDAPFPSWAKTIRAKLLEAEKLGGGKLKRKRDTGKQNASKRTRR